VVLSEFRHKVLASLLPDGEKIDVPRPETTLDAELRDR